MNSGFGWVDALRLGWRTLWRDARAGDLTLMVLAIALAVSALTAVGFFADRLKSGLQRDARAMMGGDAVLVGDQPIPKPFKQMAAAQGLTVTEHLSFPTMARADAAHGGAAKLVALKAVGVGYPLRGSLLTSAAPGGAVTASKSGPAAGEVWADAALLGSLQVSVGDGLLLGDARLRVSRVLEQEPDRGVGFLNFAPRVLMNSGDLPATQLIQPASRVSYRFAVAGDQAAVKRFVAQVQAELDPSGDANAATPWRGLRLDSVDAGRPEMLQTMDRAEKFLNLVALLSALLSAMAVALAARSFAAKHLDACAMLRVLGLSQRHIATAYAAEFAGVGLLASAVGVAIGFGAHFVLVTLLRGVMAVDLPWPSWSVAFMGLAVGLTLLMAFGLPPVLQLARVPAVRVIRREVGTINAASASAWVLGLAGFAALLLGISGDAKMGGIALVGFAGALALFAAVGWVVLRVLRGLAQRAAGSSATWVLAVRQVAARPGQTLVQVAALGTGMLALVLLVLLRTDLMRSWQAALPADAPNRFVINIQPDQAADFRRLLAEQQVVPRDWYPMIRGRLVAINDQPVVLEQLKDERAKRLLDREFNLSNSAQMPSHNELVGGAWRAGEADGASVEEGIANTLGLKLGDRLRFDVGGTVHESRITSLRRVEWGSMRANFYVMFPVADMPRLSTTYMTAYRVPGNAGQAAAFDNRLLAQFPNVTSVDMTATIAQVQQVLSQVVRAVESLFVFSLLAGVLVLISAVGASREARKREFAIMRALGASRALLARVQRLELMGVGALAGLMASAVGVLVGWQLANRVFEFAWTPSPWVPLLACAASALLAWLGGTWSLRAVLNQPVVQTLREATASM